MAEINGKWLKDNSVKEDAIELKSYDAIGENGWLQSSDGRVIARKENGGGGNERIIFGALPQAPALSVPSDNDDLVNKSYVDAAVFGLRDMKDAVRLASTGAILAYTAADGPGTNGDPVSIGRTLTCNTNSKLTLDGIDASDGDRVLLRSEGIYNGIWVVTDAGTDGVDPFILTKAEDFDRDAFVTYGSSCMVLEGSTLAQSIFAVTTPDPIVVDTTAITFAEIPNPAKHYKAKKDQFVMAVDPVPTDENFNLTFVALDKSLQVSVKDGPILEEGTDYTVSGSVLTIKASIQSASGAARKLASGDVIDVHYGN